MSNSKTPAFIAFIAFIERIGKAMVEGSRGVQGFPVVQVCQKLRNQQKSYPAKRAHDCNLRKKFASAQVGEGFRSSELRRGGRQHSRRKAFCVSSTFRLCLNPKAKTLVEWSATSKLYPPTIEARSLSLFGGEIHASYSLKYFTSDRSELGLTTPAVPGPLQHHPHPKP